jgi:large conductance mechanosensitive channel
MLKEFKDFAMKGNVIDMAVGVILGGAFGKIISSMVEDVIMPPLGLLLGKSTDFKDYFVVLKPGVDTTSLNSLKAARDAGVPVLAYGQFITQAINFLIIAFCIFLVISMFQKGMDKIVKKKPAEPEKKDCPYCFSSISAKATRCPNCTSEVAKASA